MVIQRIGVLSLGKIGATLHGGLGLVLGAVFTLVSLASGGFSQTEGGQPGGQIMTGLLGMGAIILFPLLYAAMGFIGGLFSALIYNLTAKVIGGLEIEIS